MENVSSQSRKNVGDIRPANSKFVLLRTTSFECKHLNCSRIGQWNELRDSSSNSSFWCRKFWFLLLLFVIKYIIIKIWIEWHFLSRSSFPPDYFQLVYVRLPGSLVVAVSKLLLLHSLIMCILCHLMLCPFSMMCYPTIDFEDVFFLLFFLAVSTSLVYSSQRNEAKLLVIYSVGLMCQFQVVGGSWSDFNLIYSTEWYHVDFQNCSQPFQFWRSRWVSMLFPRDVSLCYAPLFSLWHFQWPVCNRS